jgi:hypothetical protein
MNVVYKHWSKSLKDAKPLEGPVGFPKDGLSAGFFRHRRNGYPVAIWMNGDMLVYKVYNEPIKYVDERWEESYFSQCEAVLESSYREAMSTGVWRDHIRVGTNAPPGGDDLTKEMENLVEVAESIARKGPAQNDDDARTAANVNARLKEIHKILADEEAAEKAPIFREINTIEDKQLKPLRVKIAEIRGQFEKKISMVERAMDAIVFRVVEPFLKAQREKQRANNEVQNLRGGGVKPAPTNVGATGAKITLKTTWHARITDYDKAVLALKENPKVKGLIQQLADAAARSTAKVPVDGVEFYSQEKAQ